MAGSSAGVIVASGKTVREFAEWLKGFRLEDCWLKDSPLTILYNPTMPDAASGAIKKEEMGSREIRGLHKEVNR